MVLKSGTKIGLFHNQEVPGNPGSDIFGLKNIFWLKYFERDSPEILAQIFLD